MNPFTQFDFIEESLKKSPKTYKKRYHVFGFKGSIDTWSTDEVWVGLPTRYAKVTSFAQRKKESDRHVKAKILIYDSHTESLEWKSLYRNKKGVYFKKYKYDIFIFEGELTEHMK